ncbi:GRN protein, partial [Spelaeornis formosus]|nr:GRN protein [Elachura formosa]
CVPQAVCCRDHQHCCPRGYTCNVATESCEKLLAPTPLLPTPSAPHWAPAVPLRTTGTHPGGLVPCSATGSCRGGQRCCQARRGSWGCCPFAQVSGGTPGSGWGWHLPPSLCFSPQGSCCSDGRHCCPEGFRCTRGGWGCSPQ